MKLAHDATTDTLPKVLRRNAKLWPNDAGMREKDRGIWQTYSWKAYDENVRDFALGLAACGFKRGDKLSVVGDNRPRLYWSILSAMALGGMSVPVYQDSIATELVYVLEHAEVSVIVAEDQEQVDKILSLRAQLPHLKLIVYDDGRGLTKYPVDILKSFTEVQALGAAFGLRNPDYYARELEAGRGDEVGMIAYTSGTTGRPKGVLLNNGGIIASAESLVSTEAIKRGDNWLCYLPMAWVGDTMLSLGASLVAGVTSNCPESPETVIRDLRELGPDALLGPPRIWENMMRTMQIKAGDASPLKRRVYGYFRDLAERRELLTSDGKPVPAMMSLMYKLGDVVVYGPVRDQLGVRKARWCLTGGAPLGADTFRFFRSFGINLKQVYGATEASALVATQSDSEADPNTVGKPLPGVQIRVDEHGEVLVKSPGVFAGYYKQAEATRETLTPDGWLKTGDAGLMDPRGHLAIIDRAKDVGKLSDGTPFAPQFIENKLKFCPMIREAVAFGDQRPFVSAMIAIDINIVGNWAERRGLAYTSFMDLSRKPEVAALIMDEVAKVNQTLPEAAKVRRILLLNKDLEADDAEMTRTRKIRRRFVAEKYAGVIDAFYSGARETEVTMDITFEDGRKSTITNKITIQDVPAVAAPPSARGRRAA
jgi:long-chain acyl-CoA synthetase